MKIIRKLTSVFMAVAILFSVCAMSVFADPLTTDTDGTHFYHVNGVDCLGTLEFTSTDRNLEYRTYCRNISYTRDIYDLYAQCAIRYSDESEDFHYALNNPNIEWDREDYVAGFVRLPADKTVISLNADYQVAMDGEVLWDGYIDYIVGINA